MLMDFLIITESSYTHMGLIEHDDITMMSIWANDLVERAGRVLHGAIREVSLVLSGANPGALIENVTIRHSDGGEEVIDDEAIIYTGLELEHGTTEEEEEELTHADGEEDGETIQDVYDSMTDKQKDVLHYMLGQALEDNSGGSAEQSNLNDDSNETDQEGSKMTRNVFEKDEKDKSPVLSHSDVKDIVADATKVGSLKQAVENYALSHGINQIDVLFPEARALTTAPEFYTRRTEWVNWFLVELVRLPLVELRRIGQTLRTMTLVRRVILMVKRSKEEFFGTARRETAPQTIYKKQKLDRDDIIDITDFDVVAWMKGEMRLMLDEELARAILLGDGRTFRTRTRFWKIVFVRSPRTTSSLPFKSRQMLLRRY